MQAILQSIASVVPGGKGFVYYYQIIITVTLRTGILP